MQIETPEAVAPRSPEASPGRGRHNLLVGLGVAAFLAMVLFWAAIFAGKFNGTNPDTVHDAVWVRQASVVCTPAAAAMKQLPRAQEAKSAADRADLLDRGTAIVTPMVEKLAALPVANADDRKVVHAWVEDWRVYLGDRQAFAAALRKDSKAKPLVSERHGGWVTDAVDTLANANNLAECATPGDM